MRSALNTGYMHIWGVSGLLGELGRQGRPEVANGEIICELVFQSATTLLQLGEQISSYYRKRKTFAKVCE
jgi:hypothetical protein